MDCGLSGFALHGIFEYWSRLPFSSPGDLPDPEIESVFHCRQILYHLSRQGSPGWPISSLSSHLINKDNNQHLFDFANYMSTYYFFQKLLIKYRVTYSFLFNFVQGWIQTRWLIIWFHVPIRALTSHRWFTQIWVIWGSLFYKGVGGVVATIRLVRVSQPHSVPESNSSRSNPKSVRSLVLCRRTFVGSNVTFSINTSSQPNFLFLLEGFQITFFLESFPVLD